jgi:hypothetical protein
MGFLGGISLHSLRKAGYSQLGIMRRFLSIATIAALLSSFLSPLAAACTGTGKAVSCHAVEAPSHAAEAPSCDRAMHAQHHHHDAAPARQSKSTLSASVDETKCPMDCCTPGHPRTGAAVSTNSLLPPLAVSDGDCHVAPVTFVSVGFSSHTDRGPPRA